MKLFFLLLLTALAVTATAQKKVKPVVTPYDSLMRASKGNKLLGITSAVCGPIILSGGIFNLVTADEGIDYVLGGTLIGLGTAFIALAPVCLIKSKQQRNAAQQLKTTAYIYPPNICTNSNLTGVGLSVRLRF
jgi:hypothetical protein